jgi:hypothetical protein
MSPRYAPRGFLAYFTKKENTMSRTANRRCNRRLQRIQKWKQTHGGISDAWAYEILEQWQREIEFRANHLVHKNGMSVPAVWELFRRRQQEAREIGIEEDLVELCRQAIIRYMGDGNTRLGTSKIVV